MKFGQLIEYDMRNFFLEKSFTKCHGETIPRRFSKNPNLAYIWINRLKDDTVCFYCIRSWGVSKYSKTKPQTTSFCLMKRSGTRLPTSFSAWFLKKIISFVVFYELTKFQFIVAFSSKILGGMYISDCDAINFEINVIFLIKPFFLHDQKVKTKT